MAKLKIAGAWSGVLEVELEEWTVSMLREEVIRRSGYVSPPESINLICAGKLLKDGDGTEKLSQLGIKNNAKVLASKVSPDRGKSFKEESLAEEERSSRLSRLKAAATSLAQRHAEGSLPVEDFNLELENQSGEKVQLGSDTDQRAIMMGLMLHANGKALIRREQYREALEVLTMGEEAFSLCNPKVIEMVDNVAILQIDLVWCYFMLQDISWLSVAGIRLAKAREGLERAHGKEASRVRLLQGGRYPEIALHVRLELLEGVVGYHSGQFEKARQSLSSAQAKYFQLQIPDEALSVLLSMGYKEGDAKKALRMNNQDVQSAVNFLVEEKEKAANKREEDRRRQREILEQKCYGMTPLRKAVNLQYLYELVSIGFEKELAAEALRRNENDTQKALDDLTNPETNSAIQLHIESKKKKRLRQEENATIEQLVAMGFPRERVVTAVRTFGTRQAALNHLLEQSNSSSAMAADESASSLSNNGGEDGNPPITNNDGGDTVGADTDASGSNADSTGPSHSEVEEERDVEMEDELTGELLRGGSAFSIFNNGVDELKSWRVFVGFQHDEFLVSASNSVLDDGTSLPAAVGNGTVFSGFPNSDLKTAIETAGDSTQTSARVELVGTQFGVGPGNAPMPSNISLVNDGFICPKPSLQGNSTMMVCCTKDPKFKANLTKDEEFLPRKDGDLTIMYDITRSYDSNYWAQVTIANHNPLGRLDNWQLSWDWMRDEFVYNMQGAYPSVVDSSDCLFGRQGEFYKDLDFSNVLNCERRPTIIDLPLEKANDTVLGKIPFCCRNGTILPPAMDPSKSVSAFLMNVFKMPPDLNRSSFTPPQNWKISGRLNPDYKCGAPVRVSPSEFPDPSGLLPSKAVFASWQVVCNITQPKGASPRCCVSFSAYYNESVVPCSTCACGCPANTASTCSTKAPALLLPAQSLLVPFENRTKLALAWAGINHFPVPNPLPCADNCGVSINWHLFTDYRGGWSARITLFNWDDSAFADWFAAIELDKAAPGFEKVYSFNGSTLSGVDNTIFMQGLPGLNYLVGETDGANPQNDPRVPGKQQSVISFSKKNTPGINVAAGDGFPTKVFFNGEECSLPKFLPKSGSFRVSSSMLTSTILALLIFMFLRL